ncbi:EEF1A lysine methyltransferase 2-like [Penaeus japonicus]|uniref:EEF1A lysine methyltransferase 2-like n=1 Tax=Penaeus japonicus TaxID=27405 RepID=UPI001C711D22|nr:EEF1A lysine methyltransferase 2-like [Penaeus japonicus]
MEDVDKFISSKLGTKEHWESTYEQELSNFKSHGDIGDIWFGEDSMQRVVDWILESDVIKEHFSVLDIGCGNGALLLCLGSEGFDSLYGIDYCDTAIKLAKSIANSKKLDIKYETVDLLGDHKKCELTGKKYDITHDKGTYDTISLNPVDAITKRQQYIKEVHNLTKDDGLFIITSCNWTEEEIISHVSDYFEVEEVIPTPTFSFGGKVGSVVTSIVFKKVVN